VHEGLSRILWKDKWGNSTLRTPPPRFFLFYEGGGRSMGHPSVTLEKITLICPITQKRLQDPGDPSPFPLAYASICVSMSACHCVSFCTVRGESCQKHRPFDRSAFAEYKAQYNRSFAASKVESKATPCPVCKKVVTRLIFCEETAKLLQKFSMDVVTIQECSAMSSQSPNSEDRNKKDNHNPSGGLASIEDHYSMFESKRPQLLPHQLEGVNFLLSHLANNTGCILADHMGLGKTAQVIVALERYFIRTDKDRVNFSTIDVIADSKHKIQSCHSQIGRDMETVPVYAKHLSEGCSFAFYLSLITHFSFLYVTFSCFEFVRKY
jgi:hypothetical protein